MINNLNHGLKSGSHLAVSVVRSSKAPTGEMLTQTAIRLQDKNQANLENSTVPGLFFGYEESEAMTSRIKI